MALPKSHCRTGLHPGVLDSRPMERAVEQLALEDWKYEMLSHNKETIAITILDDVKAVVNELWFDD